ncbi:MAG: hypothetical protein RLZZ337_758 [Bacteroidota bacterium]
MIYKIIKLIVGLAIKLFFRKVSVSGQENIPNEGPVILVANHPNTLLDPLLVGVIAKQQVGFIAMASLFSNALLARILTYLHVLPIIRKQDLAPGQRADNITTFKKAHEYLKKKNTLVIFPEGASFYEMKLQEIKTGTARIALSFEKAENYQGGLKIVPIALDYSDSIQFRSSIAITVTPPIEVKDYEAINEQSEGKAIQALSEEIRQKLAQLIPQSEGKDQEKLIIHTHQFYGYFIDSSAHLEYNVRKSLAKRNEIADKLATLKRKDETLYNQLETKMKSFYERLVQLDITPGFFTQSFKRLNANLLIFNYVLQFIFLFPFYIYGLIINYIPYSLPLKIYKSLKLKIEYKTSVEMAAGIFVFPLFYGIQVWLFHQFISSNFWLNLLFFISLPLSGYVAMYYWTSVKRFLRLRRYSLLSKAEVAQVDCDIESILHIMKGL